MKKFTIQGELAQAIIDYLDTRPHKEVRQLIDALMQLEEQIEELKDNKK